MHTEKQVMIAHFLWEGGSVKEAAKRFKLPARTIYSWKQKDWFKELEREFDLSFRRGFWRKIQRLGAAAADVSMELLSSRDEDTRIKVALKLLEIIGVPEAEELKERRKIGFGTLKDIAEHEGTAQ